MKIIKIKESFRDKRGAIKDILYNEPIDHVTVIDSAKGVTRGNHFHKETIQWVYVLGGKLRSLTQREGEKVISKIIELGDLLKTDKYEKHALKALEDSIFIVFTRGPRGGQDYEGDTFRLEKRLEEEHQL